MIDLKQLRANTVHGRVIDNHREGETVKAVGGFLLIGGNDFLSNFKRN